MRLMRDRLNINIEENMRKYRSLSPRRRHALRATAYTVTELTNEVHRRRIGASVASRPPFTGVTCLIHDWAMRLISATSDALREQKPALSERLATASQRRRTFDDISRNLARAPFRRMAILSRADKAPVRIGRHSKAKALQTDENASAAH